MRLTHLFALLVVVLLSASPARAQVKLEQKLTSGQTIKSKETMKARQSLKLADQAIDTKSDTTIQTKLSVNEAGGLTKLSFEIESVASRVDLPGNQIIEFDSAKPAAAEEGDALAKSVREIFMSMIGSKLEATIAGGKVIVVDGVTEKMPVTADEMKVEFQQRLDQTPTEPVKPGDTWERTEEVHIGAGQTLTFRRRYEYVGATRAKPDDPASKELDEIKGADLSVLYTIRPNPQLPLTVKKSDLKIGSSGLTLLFDRQLGRVVKADGKSHILGDLTFAVGGQELNGSVDLEIESTSTEIE